MAMHRLVLWLCATIVVTDAASQPIAEIISPAQPEAQTISQVAAGPAAAMAASPFPAPPPLSGGGVSGPSQDSQEAQVASVVSRLSVLPLPEASLKKLTETPAKEAELQLPDVVQTVGQRIAQDSNRVGEIAQNLVGVQSRINLLQQEALGRVFDMQSMQNFVNSHDAAKEQNTRLRGRITDLEGQIKALTGLISQAQQQQVVSHNDHTSKMAQLAAQAQEGVFALDAIQKELAKEKSISIELDQEKHKLEQENTELGTDSIQKVEDKKVLTKELKKLDAQLVTDKEDIVSIQGDLQEQVKYAECCKKTASELEEKLKKIEAERSDDTNVAVQAQQVSLKKQLLLNKENELLKRRLAKAKQNTKTISSQINITHHEIAVLEHLGQVELAHLRTDLGQVREKVSIMETRLGEKVEERRIMERDLDAVRDQLNKERFSSWAEELGRYRANNTHMKDDIQMMGEKLTEGQVLIAETWGKFLTANETAAKEGYEARERMQKAQEVATEALKKIAEIKAKTKKIQTKTQELILKAQAATMQPCPEIWDGLHPEVLDELENTCPQVEKDLEAAKALVASLKSSLQGRS